MLAQNPAKIDVKLLRQFPEFEEFYSPKKSAGDDLIQEPEENLGVGPGAGALASIYSETLATVTTNVTKTATNLKRGVFISSILSSVQHLSSQRYLQAGTSISRLGSFGLQTGPDRGS